ncbi:unnamed protein product [Sympodiomycopsis kandeliae]
MSANDNASTPPQNEDATNIEATSSNAEVAAPEDPSINDISSFWSTESHSHNPDQSLAKAEGESNGCTQSANLAAEAARYDPFKGTELEQSRLKGNQSRQYTAAGPTQQRGYPPQMAVFPGQNASSREIGQPVSAMRTPDPQQSNEFADMATDSGDRSAVASNQYTHDQVGSDSVFGHDDHAYHHDPHQHHHHHQHDQNANAFGHPGDASQGDLSLDQGAPPMGHSTPQDTSTDADISTASTVGVKRKKNYKYLQDEPPLDGSGQRGPSEKRKKVQKACRPCKRSHMPCQEQRPCPRCIKRGIPQLCVDAEPITRRPRKSGVESGVDDSTGDVSEIQQLARAAQAAAAAAAEQAGEAGVENGQGIGGEEEKHIPSLDEMEQETIEQIRKLMKTTEEDILDQFATLPLRLLAHPDLAPNEAPANQFEEQASAQSGTKYSYTRSYSELAKWALEKLSPSGVLKLDEIVKEARRAALQSGLAVSPQEVRDLEVEFQHTVSDMRASVIDQVPTPMMVARRSGEIYAVNKHAAERFALPQPATNDPIGNIIQFGNEKTNLRIADLLLQSLTKSIGSVVSATIGFRAKATDKSDKRFIISLETRQGKGGIPLLVAITLTPLEATT